MFRKLLHPRRRPIVIRIGLVIAVICFFAAWHRDSLFSRSRKSKSSIEDVAGDEDLSSVGHKFHPPPPGANFQTNNNFPNQKQPKVIQRPPLESDSTFDKMSIEKYERNIKEINDKVIPGLGSKGDAVVLRPEEQELVKDSIKKYAFNLIASDRITLNRTTPDNRFHECHKIQYDEYLPSASVVIIFTNEMWTPLLRTVYTVLNYSPPQHLHEIVLLDDFSDLEELKGQLDYYVSKYLPPKVKIVRAKERLGLIRARVEGAKAATGDVIIFLDSHCEATTGWLEPLLHRIKENRHAVLLPIIDVISDDTMEFYRNAGSSFQVGGFTWSGHFTWIRIPEREEKRKKSFVSPTRSPTMAGGLFAVDRKFFWELGGYDEGMDVWGGENLEISFRIWMCGGLLETIPCSHVGHIFRAFHPYTFPGNKDTHGLNTARMAEVWMDDYKRLFYLYRREMETSDYGDVSARKKLRQDLKCTSFKWYLDNIYPEKFILDENVLAYGRIKNEKSRQLCFDMLQRDEKHEYVMGLYYCHQFQSGSQFMSLSKSNELRREDTCGEVARSTNKLTMNTCHGKKGNQEWIHTKDGPLIHKKTGLCLDILNGTSDSDIMVANCDGSIGQKWSFDVYLEL